MSLYIYEAYNKEGEITKGDFEASGTAEVVEYLRKRELSPVEIKKAGKDIVSSGLFSVSFFENITTIDVIFMVRNLGATVKSGLSITESLDILIADAEKTKMKNILIGVRSGLNNGVALSKSFEADKKYFPPIFIGMLRAGEYGGQLDKTFEDLGKYLSKEYSLVQKIKSALTYPVILLVSSLLVVALMLIFILPQLTRVFQTSGVKVPAVTQFFLSLSGFLSKHYVLDFVIMSGIVWFFTGFRRTESGRKVFYYILSKTPVAKELIKKVLLVRFSRSLGNLVGNGVPVIEALELSADSIGNHVYKRVILETAEEVKNGIAISKVISQYPNLFPNIFVSLMAVGEKTGTLGQVLTNFADFYEEDVDNKLKDLTSLLEPLLLLFMGLFIGVIAFSILMPVYQLVGKFV